MLEESRKRAVGVSSAPIAAVFTMSSYILGGVGEDPCDGFQTRVFKQCHRQSLE